jgi:hypothetical protein
MREAETIQKISRAIGADIERKVLDPWSQELYEKGSNGIELIIGIRNAFMSCLAAAGEKAGYSETEIKKHAHAMVESWDGHGDGGRITRQASMIISPNGRPYASPPKL